jgi:hypothetical protein
MKWRPSLLRQGTGRHEPGSPSGGLFSSNSNFGCLPDSGRPCFRQKPEARMLVTRRQHWSPASAICVADRCFDPLHCSGEASSIMAHVATRLQRRLVCWLGRCVYKLSDGLADDPRDRSVSRQRYLIKCPIILFFEAHRQPRCLARTLVHATLHAFPGRNLSVVTSEFNEVMHFHQQHQIRVLDLAKKVRTRGRRPASS